MDIMGRFIEFLKERWKQILGWVLFLLVATFLINTYLIPDRQIPIQDLPRINESNISYIYSSVVRSSITQQIQDSINSGNLMDLFWEVAYLGPGLDKLCFKVDNTNGTEVNVSHNLGESYLINRIKCFKIPPTENKTTFNLVYESNISVPQFYTVAPNLTILSCYNQGCRAVPNFGDPVISCTQGQCKLLGYHLIITYPPKYLPYVSVYFEANIFHKIVKFFFIFILVSLLTRELVESARFFIFGNKSKVKYGKN